MTYDAWLAWMRTQPHGDAVLWLMPKVACRKWLYDLMEAYRKEEHDASKDAESAATDRDEIARRLLVEMAKQRD